MPGARPVRRRYSPSHGLTVDPPSSKGHASASRRPTAPIDLFALVNALSWITGQAPAIEARRAHLLALVMDGLAHPGIRG
ncbi:hypothetical protein AB0469_39175 [Streptomyces sp. NPDC093801]|uniref:hypothetical protein n=1 Tax=Streptomyces sp. NPDC093801 TaxID=3155203 RepID=UPI003450682F